MATNKVNGKRYVGQTQNSLKKRIKDHYYQSLEPRIVFHKALNKYGSDFDWEILESDINTIEELNKKERYYISKMNSLISGHGYNVKLGGDNHKRVSGEYHPNYGKTLEEIHGKKMAEHIRKKIAEVHKGTQHSEEHKKKISEQTCGKNNPRYREIDIKYIKKLYKSGKSLLEISQELNLSRTQVKQRLVDEGVQLRSQSEQCKIRYNSYHDHGRYYTVNVQYMIDLYTKGHSIPSIAKYLNIDRNKVRRELQRNNVSIRNQSEQMKLTHLIKQQGNTLCPPTNSY